MMFISAILSFKQICVYRDSDTGYMPLKYDSAVFWLDFLQNHYEIFLRILSNQGSNFLIMLKYLSKLLVKLIKKLPQLHSQIPNQVITVNHAICGSEVFSLLPCAFYV